MALVLYNTLTRQKELFTPAVPGQVTMYVCGPTVYSFPHIGNARPAVVFDTLARLLRTRYRVIYARNITDVDDKINRAAADEGVDIDAIATRYAAVYHQDMAALGVAPPDIEPRATAHMPEMLDMIGRLVASGHAYAADGHVLFRVKSFPRYGELSRRDRRELLAGARVEEFFGKLIKNEVPFVDIPYPVTRAVQQKYEFSINEAGLDAVIEKAKSVRATSDSLKAQQAPPPGGAPQMPAPAPAPDTAKK